MDKKAERFTGAVKAPVKGLANSHISSILFPKHDPLEQIHNHEMGL